MPERSGKNVRRCQKYFRWYVRNYVRNYIRMVCQGRDHSKKVISIVRLAPPKGTTWAVFEPCLVDDEFGDCTSQHTGDNNNNIIIISRYLIIQRGNPVLHQPIVSFCWHFHVLPATCSSPGAGSGFRVRNPSDQLHNATAMDVLWHSDIDLEKAAVWCCVWICLGCFTLGLPEAPMSNWGCFPPQSLKLSVQPATRLV